MEKNVRPAALVDQLCIVTVAGDQAGELRERLTRDSFYATQIDSRGGLLQEPRVTMVIGVDSARQARLLQHIRECCPTRRRFIPTHLEASPLPIHAAMIEAEVGGAIVHVVDVEHFERI